MSDIIHQAIVLQRFLRTDFPFHHTSNYMSMVCSLSLPNSQPQLCGKRGIPGPTIPQGPSCKMKEHKRRQEDKSVLYKN